MFFHHHISIIGLRDILIFEMQRENVTLSFKKIIGIFYALSDLYFAEDNEFNQ